MRGDGPPKAEIPNPDEWLRKLREPLPELEEPDDRYWQKELGFNPMKEKNWT